MILAENRTMARRTPFRQSDLSRVLKAALSAGVPLSRVEIDPDGKIVLVAVGERRELTSDFDAWKAKRDARPT